MFVFMEWVVNIMLEMFIVERQSFMVCLPQNGVTDSLNMFIRQVNLIMTQFDYFCFLEKNNPLPPDKN